MLALKAGITWLFSLAVLVSSSTPDETVPLNCSSQTQLLERLSADVKVAVECGAIPRSGWSVQQTAELLVHMRNVTDTLHKHQLEGCHGAEPSQCPEAEVPANGGLACVTVSNKRYCKPLCNHGYDFGFLRRSRLFDECSEQTNYKWQSQYIGGNQLAVCNEASFQISGAPTAYFPKDQDCLTTRSSSHLTNILVDGFISELQGQQIQGEKQSGCLVCG